MKRKEYRFLEQKPKKPLSVLNALRIFPIDLVNLPVLSVLKHVFS